MFRSLIVGAITAYAAFKTLRIFRQPQDRVRPEPDPNEPFTPDQGDRAEAVRICNKAKVWHDRAKDKTEKTRRQLMERASVHGEVQIDVARDNVGEFLRLLETMKIQGESLDADLLKQITRQKFIEYKDIVDLSNALAGGAIAYAETRNMKLTAAVSLAGLFRKSIASLGSAEVKSATLAWLAGDSLAADDSIVLDGVAVASVLNVMERSLAGKGEDALSHAREYENDVNIACEELNSLCEFLKKARKRVDELEKVLRDLSGRAKTAIERIDIGDFDFSRSDDLAQFTEVFSLVNDIVDVLKTPVLDEAGNLNSDWQYIKIQA